MGKGEDEKVNKKLPTSTQISEETSTQLLMKMEKLTFTIIADFSSLDENVEGT